MKRILLSLGLTASLLFTFACERKGGPGAGGQTGPIVIGYYGDLTGRTSNFGQSTKAGVEMAADEINKAGGINGRQITILSEDDEGVIPSFSCRRIRSPPEAWAWSPNIHPQ